MLKAPVILYTPRAQGFRLLKSTLSPPHHCASGYLTYLSRLIRHGFAVPFTAHATSPTITMPRVKAMTTGTVPSFLDVILNFAESDTTSNLALQDTWLAQLKDKPGGKLTMYGDDTWMKLFPSTFSRADGTSSFFVSVSGTSRSSCTVKIELNQIYIRTLLK